MVYQPIFFKLTEPVSKVAISVFLDILALIDVANPAVGDDYINSVVRVAVNTEITRHMSFSYQEKTAKPLKTLTPEFVIGKVATTMHMGTWLWVVFLDMYGPLGW